MDKWKTALLTGVLAVSTGVASAQSGWYTRASGGGLNTTGVTGLSASSGLSQKDKSSIYQLFPGYGLNSDFSFEGGYVSPGRPEGFVGLSYLGKWAESGNGSDPASRWFGSKKSTTYFIDALGSAPVLTEVSMFGKIGAAYTSSKFSSVGLGTGILGERPSYEPYPGLAGENMVAPKLSLGAEYSLSRGLALRVEYDKYFNLGERQKMLIDSDIGVWSIGLKSSF